MRRVISRVVIAGTVFLWVAAFPGVARSAPREGPGAASVDDSTRAMPSGSSTESTLKNEAPQGSPAIPIWSGFPGGASSGGGFDLGSGLGQPVVGPGVGGAGVLNAGFLAAAGTTDASLVFSDGFETGDSSRWTVTTGSGF